MLRVKVDQYEFRAFGIELTWRLGIGFGLGLGKYDVWIGWEYPMEKHLVVEAMPDV